MGEKIIQVNARLLEDSVERAGLQLPVQWNHAAAVATPHDNVVPTLPHGGESQALKRCHTLRPANPRQSAHRSPRTSSARHAPQMRGETPQGTVPWPL